MASVGERAQLFSAYQQAKETKASDDELGGLLKRFLVSHADPYVAISDSHYSNQDSQNVRAGSIAYYGLQNEKFCQVLGSVDPNHVSVVNAHIWPCSAAQDLGLFDLDSSFVHNPQNVLRLQKDIERAFDERKLTFVSDNVSTTLVVKVLRKATLSEALTGTNKTFDNINGSKLSLPNGSPPFRRLLAHHSVVSHKYARAQTWIVDEDLSQAEIDAATLIAHSLDEEAQSRLKLLWRT